MHCARNLLFSLLVVLPARIVSGQSKGLRVVSSLNLTVASDGFSGRVELLQDSRLTPDLAKLLWGSGGPELALDPGDPLYKELTALPLKDAAIRLVDQHSRTIQELTLKREQALIGAELLHPGFRTILVTTDLSAGFGSYSGLFTELIDVSRGRFEFVDARDAQSGARSPIYLGNTLKTAWKLVAAPGNSGKSKDILEIACRPNADASVFYLTYSRYSWSGTEWVVFTRRVPGMWEADEPFPASERFPRSDSRAQR